MNVTVQPALSSQCLNGEVTQHDQELLHAARAGSEAAFAELRSMYAHRLYKRILSITRNHEDAEDALQNTFFKAYLALPAFQGRCRVSSWLTKIAINSALMILRRHRARPEMPFEEQSGFDENSSSFDVRDRDLTPEQICDQHQRCDAMLNAVEKLEPKSRTIVRIRMVHGNSMQEIAQSLGVTSASVKARLHRARKRLVQSPDLSGHSTRVSARGKLICRLEDQKKAA